MHYIIKVPFNPCDEWKNFVKFCHGNNLKWSSKVEVTTFGDEPIETVTMTVNQLLSKLSKAAINKKREF